MIVLYTSPGCSSCRKVKTYLKDNNIAFIEKNIFKVLLNDDEIKYLISRTLNGTDDLISKNSKIIKNSNLNIDDMSINELCEYIINNPSILKRPIIIDDKNMLIGYDDEEIEVFNKLRNIAKCDLSCSHYKTCGQLREEIN